MIIYEVFYEMFDIESLGFYILRENAETKLFALQDNDPEYADCYHLKAHLVVDGEQYERVR